VDRKYLCGLLPYLRLLRVDLGESLSDWAENINRYSKFSATKNQRGGEKEYPEKHEGDVDETYDSWPSDSIF